MDSKCSQDFRIHVISQFGSCIENAFADLASSKLGEVSNENVWQQVETIDDPTLSCML